MMCESGNCYGGLRIYTHSGGGRELIQPLLKASSISPRAKIRVSVTGQFRATEARSAFSTDRNSWGNFSVRSGKRCWPRNAVWFSSHRNSSPSEIRYQSRWTAEWNLAGGCSLTACFVAAAFWSEIGREYIDPGESRHFSGLVMA